MTLSEPLHRQIAALLTQHRVVLFMKGTRRMPQCAFSAQIVRILDPLLPSYETIDAVRSPEVREGQQGQIETAQLAVDPHGYIDFAVALARLLGFDLCPRLEELKQRRLSVCARGKAVAAEIAPVVVASVDTALIGPH